MMLLLKYARYSAALRGAKRPAGVGGGGGGGLVSCSRSPIILLLVRCLKILLGIGVPRLATVIGRLGVVVVIGIDFPAAFCKAVGTVPSPLIEFNRLFSSIRSLMSGTFPPLRGEAVLLLWLAEDIPFIGVLVVRRPFQGNGRVLTDSEGGGVFDAQESLVLYEINGAAPKLNTVAWRKERLNIQGC